MKSADVLRVAGLRLREYQVWAGALLGRLGAASGITTGTQPKWLSWIQQPDLVLLVTAVTQWVLRIGT